LKKDMPSVFGKEKKQKELIKNLDALYSQLQREHQISPGDFPDISKMQEVLGTMDFTKFRTLDMKLLDRVDKMLSDDIAKLMAMVPLEEQMGRERGTDKIEGGAFSGVMDAQTPFMFKGGEGVNAGQGEVEWVVAKERYKYDAMFDDLSPIDGKVTGASAKGEMIKSKLPNNVLGKIWKLSDVDRDGMLDSDEFALAMHLMNIKLDGNDLPQELPPHLIPPSKRGF